MYKIVDLNIDINELSTYLKEVIIPNNEFIGQLDDWSVLLIQSFDGSCNSHCTIPIWKNKDNMITDKFLHSRSIINQIISTKLNVGLIKKTMDKVIEAGFTPVNARISKLLANGIVPWHTDRKHESNDKFSPLKGHIPIITNDKCIFEYQNGGSYHFPADGNMYILGPDKTHRIINNSTEDRYHLFFDLF